MMSQAPSIHRVAFTGREIAEFFYEGIRGVLDYAEQAKHWQLVGRSTGSFLPFDEIDLSAVDGVIGFFHDHSWVQKVIQSGVSAVDISNRYAELILPRVACDDEAVGRMGAAHLLERGFVDFGFVGPFSTWYTQRRHDGFRHVIEGTAHRTCHTLSIHINQTNLHEVIAEWLQPLLKPIGIMAASDQEGRILIDQAVELGLRVPDDVAVLGVDNRRWLTQLARVSMSSIELDQRQIGYRAAKLLDGLMAGEVPPPPQWIAPLGVVTRRSTDIVVTSDPIVAHAMQYIREHCAEAIGVEDILDQLGVSRKTFELRLKRVTGLTPQVAIFRAQVDRAKKMLVGSDKPMYRIAEACGFDREPRFFLVFKRETGMTPGEYRRRFGSQQG